MKVFSKVVNILSSFLDRVAGWVFAGLMVLAVINVILRAFFNSPIKGTFEHVSYYTGLAIALSIAFCTFMFYVTYERVGHIVYCD